MFEQLLHQAHTHVFLGMGHTQMTWFVRVHKHMVRAFDATQNPSSLFQSGDEVFALHAEIIHTVHTIATGMKKPC